jgi:hypothetical protein
MVSPCGGEGEEEEVAITKPVRLTFPNWDRGPEISNLWCRDFDSDQLDHPHVRPVVALGYRFLYSLPLTGAKICPEARTWFWIAALDPSGAVVAGASFFQYEPNPHFCDRVEVLAEHRRRGLATALYVLAELKTGRPLDNFWKKQEKVWEEKTGRQINFLTEEGNRFWNQPNRPFGTSN